MCVRTRIGKDGQYFSDPERKLGHAAQVAPTFFSFKRAAYSCLFLLFFKSENYTYEYVHYKRIFVFLL